MKVYTLSNGNSTQGTTVRPYTLKNTSPAVSFPAITVGEFGRGRSLGVLPVALLPEQEAELVATGKTTLHHAVVGATRSGAPKLLARPNSEPGEDCILVILTDPGYRGGCEQAGDLLGWSCWTCDLKKKTGDSQSHIKIRGGGNVPENCPVCGESRYSSTGPKASYADFPGKVVCRGATAQGDAGAMGGGPQIVAIVPQGSVVAERRTGRLYGNPPVFLHKIGVAGIISATPEERDAGDLF